MAMAHIQRSLHHPIRSLHCLPALHSKFSMVLGWQHWPSHDCLPTVETVDFCQKTVVSICAYIVKCDWHSYRTCISFLLRLLACDLDSSPYSKRTLLYPVGKWRCWYFASEDTICCSTFIYPCLYVFTCICLFTYAWWNMVPVVNILLCVSDFVHYTAGKLFTTNFLSFLFLIMMTSQGRLLTISVLCPLNKPGLGANCKENWHLFLHRWHMYTTLGKVNSQQQGLRVSLFAHFRFNGVLRTFNSFKFFTPPELFKKLTID